MVTLSKRTAVPSSPFGFPVDGTSGTAPVPQPTSSTRSPAAPPDQISSKSLTALHPPLDKAFKPDPARAGDRVPGPSNACSAPKSLAGRAERRCHNKKHRRHRLEKSPVPRKMSPLHATGSRRCLHFGKCACKRQLVPSRTSADLGEQKANQSVRGPLGSLVISLRHCQTSVMAIPGKSPVPRKGPRSTLPGPVGAWISDNARASGTYLHGH